MNGKEKLINNLLAQSVILETTKTDRFTDVFNEPEWMNNLNTELLIRYWQKKGSPGFLRLRIAGATMHLRKYEMGTVSYITVPTFNEIL